MATLIETPLGPGLRHGAPTLATAAPVVAAAAPPIPAWARETAAQEEAIDVVRPSRLGPSLALGDAAEQAAATRIKALLGRDGSYDELNAGLADAIRAGTIAWDDPHLLAHLAATARDMLAIDQPRYAHQLHP